MKLIGNSIFSFICLQFFKKLHLTSIIFDRNLYVCQGLKRKTSLPAHDESSKSKVKKRKKKLSKKGIILFRF